MTKKNTTDQLITELCDDMNNDITSLQSNTSVSIKFSLVAIICTSLIMSFIQEFRADWWQQLQDSPRFLLETLLGFIAIFILCFGVLTSSIPGHTKRISYIGLGLLCCWLLIILSGFITPVLEPSMSGKRDSCQIEVILYSLPMIVVMTSILNRRYVINTYSTSLQTVLFCTMIPAYLMQIACMYEIHHALLHHLLPAIGVTLVVSPLVSMYLKNNH